MDRSAGILNAHRKFDSLEELFLDTIVSQCCQLIKKYFEKGSEELTNFGYVGLYKNVKKAARME